MLRQSQETKTSGKELVFYSESGETFGALSKQGCSSIRVTHGECMCVVLKRTDTIKTGKPIRGIQCWWPETEWRQWPLCTCTGSENVLQIAQQDLLVDWKWRTKEREASKTRLAFSHGLYGFHKLSRLTEFVRTVFLRLEVP